MVVPLQLGKSERDFNSGHCKYRFGNVKAN